MHELFEIRNSQRHKIVPARNFMVLWDEIFLMKSRDTSVTHNFLILKAEKTTKWPPTKHFLHATTFRHPFGILFLWITKLYGPDNWLAPENFRKTIGFQKYKNGQFAEFSLLWDKKLWKFPGETLTMAYPRHRPKHLRSVDFDPFPACFSFVHIFFKRKTVNTVLQFFLFQVLQKSRKLRASDFLACCLKHI